MATYNVHGGHSLICRGASGLLDEVNEDRKVKNRVIELLRAEGHTVYDCTDDSGRTQGQNLSAIVIKCNAHKVDLDISIHLNAGGGTGVEVENYNGNTAAISDRICENISSALGIRNRGTKYMKDLYVLRNTKSPAILIECCFVDNATDKAAWNVDKCAKAIVEGILNTTVSSGSSTSTAAPTPAPTPKPTPTPTPSVDASIVFKYMVRAGGRWYPEVRNLGDYAGVRGKAITDVAIGVTQGSVKYRVHVKGGGWLPYVTGYNTSDGNNGYAGNGREIDAIEVYYNTPSAYANKYGYKKAKYRVAVIGRDYYSWQYDNEKGNGMDGYAGAFGRSMDRFQICPN
ncbi:N-acetylmuramoyl-L-alanine amidase [Lachnospiraceae bacterium SGI.054]